MIAASLYESTTHDPSKASSVAPAAVTMLFLFNLCYAAMWRSVAFLILTEIFPSETRAQGNGFGIAGWAIGVGCAVLVNPTMFGSIKSRTYFPFAALNLIWIPIAYFFYPETKDRSLESIEAMFSSSSPLYSAVEKSYQDKGDVIAMKGGREEVGRKMSVISISSQKRQKQEMEV